MMWPTEEYRRIFLPYAVVKMNDESGGWIPLNRRYKPVGMSTEDWVEYEQFPKALRIKQITLPQQKKIHHGCERASPWRPNEIIWLYHDTCVPTDSPLHWKSYQDRLFVLSRLKCFGTGY